MSRSPLITVVSTPYCTCVPRQCRLVKLALRAQARDYKKKNLVCIQAPASRMALPGTFATEIILEFCCLGKCPDSRKKVPKMGFPFLTLTLGDTRISSSLTPGIVYVPVDTYWCPRHTCVLLLYS